MTQVFTNIRRLATCAAGLKFDDVGWIDDPALVVENERLKWIGLRSELPDEYASAEKFDLEGGLVLPGLVDCHTHLAFGGWRDGEFSQRCRGASYQEIAAGGGGIVNTVRNTRLASETELRDRALGFLNEMTRCGVATVEVKSGYGLTCADELKLLRAYKSMINSVPQTIVATFLGAHTIPPEFKTKRADYLKELIEVCLPVIEQERLAQFCDVFVEEGAFTADEARTLFAAAKRHGLRPKLHVDQLSDGGGAALAAEVGAISADHLEFTGDAGIAALAKGGVIAVALPIASLYLRQPYLDARKYQAAGVPVAVATDFNPGTAPCSNLPLAMNLACTQNRMTPAAALRGATIVAAQAIDMQDDVGSLEVGQRADFVVLDEESVDAWLYRLPPSLPRSVFIAGQSVVHHVEETK